MDRVPLLKPHDLTIKSSDSALPSTAISSSCTPPPSPPRLPSSPVTPSAPPEPSESSILAENTPHNPHQLNDLRGEITQNNRELIRELTDIRSAVNTMRIENSHLHCTLRTYMHNSCYNNYLFPPYHCCPVHHPQVYADRDTVDAQNNSQK